MLRVVVGKENVITVEPAMISMTAPLPGRSVTSRTPLGLLV